MHCSIRGVHFFIGNADLVGQSIKFTILTFKALV